MRIIIILLALVALFAFLARLLPPAYYLPLYCLFLIGGTAYLFWERRQIQARQTQLEEEYQASEIDWQAMGWGEAEEE